jgi:hypothetical protein
VQNPKIVGFSLMPNKADLSVLPRTFAECLKKAQRKFPDLGHVGFNVNEDAGDSGRHYAYCQQFPDDSLAITFAPRAAGLTRKHLLGLMFHELGHAIDFRFPVEGLTRRVGSGIPRERERRADEIARRTFNHVIQYDPKIGFVQCVACNGVSPRPGGLK